MSFQLGGPTDPQASDATGRWSITSLLKGMFAKTAAENSEILLLASATRTVLQVSADQLNLYARGVIVTLDVAAASGTGGLSIAVQGKDALAGKYHTLGGATASVTAVGTYVYIVYPGASGVGTRTTSAPLPRAWRIQVSHADSTNYTYGVTANLVL